ncbi:hypothetical protein XENORESO_009867, partial [Xenotaenia resolanae]
MSHIVVPLAPLTPACLRIHTIKSLTGAPYTQSSYKHFTARELGARLLLFNLNTVFHYLFNLSFSLSASQGRGGAWEHHKEERMETLQSGDNNKDLLGRK